jgi:hypothetical protein
MRGADRRRRVGLWIALTLFSTTTFGVASTSRAQFNGDPFDPFRARYSSSSRPTANQFVPGQGRRVTPPGMGNVPGIGLPFDSGFGLPSPAVAPPASRFEREMDTLLSPSNDVYRRYDEQFNRVYRPNAEADEQFARTQEARQQLYFEAMNEKNPERRAELLKQYRDLSRRVSLGMSPTNRRGGDRADRQPGEGAAPRDDGLPRTVRSYEDLVQWSRAINREALESVIEVPDPD